MKKQELVAVYMPISRDEAKGMELDFTNMEKRHIGIKNVPCIKTEGTADFSKRWETMLDTEARSDLRDKRCNRPDGRGGWIRCPEKFKCSKCMEHFKANFHNGHASSLNKPVGENSEDESVDFIPGGYVTEDTILVRIILEDLLSYLSTFKGKNYDMIFLMLYEQYSTQEIADDLELAWSTAKDAINRVRKLAQEYTNLSREDLY